MQNTDIQYRISVTGVEDAKAQFESLGATIQKININKNGQMTAIGRTTDALKGQAAATDQVTKANNRASVSQAGFFAHIAKTTIQSALVNKLFLEMVDVMGQSIQQVDLMQNFPATMASMGQSTDAASESMQKLRDYVGQVGGNLGDATSYVTRFVGATGDVKAATAIYTGLNNALIAGDSSLEEQRQAAIQFAQSLERGKPDLREWRTLTQNMSFQLAQVADAMGYVNANALGEALTAGEESMAAFTTTLTQLSTGMGPIAQQAMARMNGMQFAFNVLKNTMVQGLAAIINAIGRSNIVSFFSFLTQVVQVLTSVVVGLIKAFMTLLNLFFGLFGLPKLSLQNDVEGVASAIGDGAGNAEDLSDGLGSAGKAAKELNKSLASFDKMNVLPEKENKSAAGGGAGGAGGGGGAGFDAGQLGDLGSLFDELGKGIQEVSKWAKIFAGILIGLALNSLIKKLFNVNPLALFIDGIGKLIGKLGSLPGAIVGLVSKIGSSIASWYNSAKNGVVNFGKAVIDKTKFAVAAVIETWKDFGPKVAQGFRELKAGIVTVLNNLGIIEPLTRLKNNVILLFNGLKDNIIGVFDPIRLAIIAKLSPIVGAVVDTFNNVKEKISGVLQAIRSGSGTIVSAIVSEIGSKFGLLKAIVQDRVSGIKNVVQTVFDGIVGAAQNFAAPIAASIRLGFDQYVAPLAGPLAKIGTNIGKGVYESMKWALEPIGALAGGTISRLKSGFSTVGSAIATPIRNSINAVSGKISDIGHSISTKMGAGFKRGLTVLGGIFIAGLLNVLRNGPEVLTEAFNNLLNIVLNGPQIITGIITAVQNMFATVAAQTDIIFAAIGQVFTTIVDAIQNDGPRMVEAFFTMLGRLIDTLTSGDALSRMIAGAITLITKIVEGIANVLPKVISAIVTLVTDLINKITEPEFLDKMITTAIELLTQIIMGLIEVLPKIIDGMVKLILAMVEVLTRPEILDKLIDATIGLILAITFALIDNIDKLIMAAVRLVLAIAKGLWDNRDKILDAIKQIGLKIIEKIGEVDWVNLGWDIVRGIWGGINNAKDWIIEKIKGFGSAVLNGMKSFFGISSPSKVMRDQVGKMLGVGLAEGITDSTSLAVQSAEDAANSVKDVFTNMQSDVGSLDSNFTVGGVLSSINPQDYTQEDVDIVQKTGTSNGGGQMLNLKVFIGEEQITSKMIDLINERSSLSGRNAIYV